MRPVDALAPVNDHQMQGLDACDREVHYLGRITRLEHSRREDLDAISPGFKSHRASAFVIGPDHGVKTLAHPAKRKDHIALRMGAQSARIALARNGEGLPANGQVDLTLAPILCGVFRVGGIKVDAAVFLLPCATGRLAGACTGVTLHSLTTCSPALRMPA